MARILLIRFSALGDVAMMVPVVYSLATQYPQHEITVLSRPGFKPPFARMPSNVSFIGAQLGDEHKGIAGLNRLFKTLSRQQFDYVADLHDVLRSKYLRFRFKLSGVRTAYIDKGREGKKKLVSATHKVFVQQESSFNRYADVLSRLGLPVKLNFSSIYADGQGDFKEIETITGQKPDGEKWIGIAPFAKHEGKIYPVELQEQVVAYFANKPNARVFLFGGGPKEKAVFDSWTTSYPSITSLIGKLNMEQELNLISQLNVMLSMDSANMHLASLVGTPVVSVWGATHPYAGFMGWNQSPSNAVQLDMSCRPCSVFGQKPCARGDFACLKDISPQQIIEKIEKVLA